MFCRSKGEYKILKDLTVVVIVLPSPSSPTFAHLRKRSPSLRLEFDTIIFPRCSCHVSPSPPPPPPPRSASGALNCCSASRLQFVSRLSLVKPFGKVPNAPVHRADLLNEYTPKRERKRANSSAAEKLLSSDSERNFSFRTFVRTHGVIRRNIARLGPTSRENFEFWYRARTRKKKFLLCSTLFRFASFIYALRCRVRARRHFVES